MNDNNQEPKVHETQPSTSEVTLEDTNVINAELLPIQIIEGGGPPKKVDLNTLPKPLKVFGYFLIVISLLMLVLVLVVTFFR